MLSDRITEKKHHIMVLEDQKGKRIPAVKWFGEDESFEGRIFDIVCRLSRNNYSKDAGIQLTLGYMIETFGEFRDLFEGEIADERNTSVESLLKRYPEAQIFYEGLQAACPIENTVDRFLVRNCDELIFLSTPSNTDIFREVIALANPQKVIINFGILPNYTFKGFVLNLLGLIKHIIKNRDGRAYVDELSMKLCVEESIVKAGLKYLGSSGMLNYTLSEDEEKVYLSEGKGVSDSRAFMAKKNLADALAEKNAYQQFILKMEIDKFKEYLK